MQNVAETIGHELAHQWFGNLITPKRWEDLWLKEGFASYMSFVALNALHKEYQIMDTYTIFEFDSAMSEDGSKNSRPISFDIKSRNDIILLFDGITYSKGCIMLRMLNSIVGDEAFRSAITDMLRDFAYKNIDRNDLWDYMTKHAHAKRTLDENMHIKDIMENWIQKPGYPVVMVERDGPNIILSQKRYMLPSKNLTDDTKWDIPITYETDELHKGDSIPTHWISKNDTQIVINDVFLSDNNSQNVVYVNLNRQGYYRVNYDTESWLALKQNFAKLPRITRAQILDDALHLAQAEYLTYDIPLTFLMEIFTNVDDELLWSAAKPGINYLTVMLEREPAYETFRVCCIYFVIICNIFISFAFHIRLL